MNNLPIEVSELIDYLNESPSAFHVVNHTKKILTEAGFTELGFKDDWHLENGGRYFVAPFATNLYAFTLGEHLSLDKPVHITAAHADFPTLKIKPNPEIVNHCHAQLNTEVYGAPILSTYFDRPLSLAGRVIVRGESYDNPISIYTDFKRPVIYIPNLAVHMNRGVNDGVKIDKQHHLLPIIGMIGEYLDKEFRFTKLLADELNVKEEDILDYDLNVYNPAQPQLVGFTGEFLSAPRLDDITSVSASIHALIKAHNSDCLNMACVFDNEEIGSLTKQGARSLMPATILAKIWQSFGRSYVDCMSQISDGYLLSLDVAHAYHPNYPGPQDITNFPVMNKGFMLKTASNQSYVWDSEGLAMIKALAQDQNIPYQHFVKESNTAGGGTIGSMLTSRMCMRGIDMGVGLLAMHSMQEMMGIHDQTALENIVTAFFTL